MCAENPRLFCGFSWKNRDADAGFLVHTLYILTARYWYYGYYSLLLHSFYISDMLEIKVVNAGHQQLPAYATPQSAGMDLRANLDEPVTLKPLERRLIPTGLHIALPQGYEAQVRPRSGLALKKGITVLNSPGTIDADYRGEIGVLLVNLSAEEFVVNDGERIAQMVIARHEQGEFVLVDELDETERGTGGYGHTGVK